MTGSPDPSARLKAMLAAAGLDAEPREDCPAPEAIWEAATEASPPDERRRIVLHMAECPVCAEAWQLARSIGHEPVERTVSRPSSIPRWVSAVAAVLLVAAGLWSARTTQPLATTPAVTRDEGPRDRIVSLIEGQTLDRQRVVLRWSGGAPGATYSVVVTTADLEVIRRADGLSEPSLVLTPVELAALEPGRALLWQVTARDNEGRRIESPTFVNRLDQNEE